MGLADTAEAVVKAWEANVCKIDDQVPGRSSGTQHMIRTACKAFRVLYDNEDEEYSYTSSVRRPR